MTKYTPTIGLEIHAELKTKTKMFCDSKNDPDETKPNINICPVCMGHPGTLPTLNKEAIKHVLKIGVAVGGNLAKDFTEFDRKNYFYPDIPKGYQISQYKYPLVSGGSINDVLLTRIHLEEDTAKSTHYEDHSLVDFNRAGLPLMELVTEPVIKSAKEAGDFARELQLLLRYLGVANANMEKGEMRVEANISISPDDNFGTKVEVKNLNSFKSVEKAIEYEIKRHESLLESGEEIIQETRGWDENKQATFSQRTKEDSHDYRYFPEPDLPKLKISKIPEFEESILEKELPELPWQRRQRYVDLGIKTEDANMFVASNFYGDFIDQILNEVSDNLKLIKIISNYVSNDVAGIVSSENFNFNNWFKEYESSVSDFIKIAKMQEGGEVSSNGANELIRASLIEKLSPDKVAEDRGILQKNDKGEITKLAKEIIEQNPEVVSDYKNGKESSIQFLVGQGMKKTKGSVNPNLLKEVIKEVIQ